MNNIKEYTVAGHTITCPEGMQVDLVTVPAAPDFRCTVFVRPQGQPERLAVINLPRDLVLAWYMADGKLRELKPSDRAVLDRLTDGPPPVKRYNGARSWARDKRLSGYAMQAKARRFGK